LVKELQSLCLDVELLGTDGQVSSGSEEQEIVVPGHMVQPITVPEMSLFQDEVKKDSKKYKKEKKK
jgi:hypothetical protein